MKSFSISFNIPPGGEYHVGEYPFRLISKPSILDEHFHGGLAYFFRQIINNRFDDEIEQSVDPLILERYRNKDGRGINHVSNFYDDKGTFYVSYLDRKLSKEDVVAYFKEFDFIVEPIEK